MLCASLICAVLLVIDVITAAPTRQLETSDNKETLQLLNTTGDDGDFEAYQKRLNDQILKTRDFFIKLAQQQRKSPGYADFVASPLIENEADCPDFLRAMGEC
ncbi:unnamed protein product, partial [Mesorhabditis belari]|uniref:Secreted protein n=1 Tax=Mesorhabditis belari TaxID=2138241 RepID=A0AAF3JC87_9BILA